ncbi:MAG: class I SAM-dependent methyltransferase [Acidobacteriota bacterium]|nr:class I SAM-dependent methyltransferase [Acidobacteriota bacterium]
MADTPDTNDEVWKSEQMVAEWVATAGDRERHRREHRRLMAELLPFADDQPFTFVDLGAGTGAATQAVLDRFAGAEAFLAEYSPQMIAEGRRALSAYEGRFSYVEFDLASGGWPEGIPDRPDAVISSLCVHHLPDHHKQELFNQIRGHLRPGGWYLNYDPVSSDDPVVESAWQLAGDRLDPQAAAKRHHRSPEEQLRWANHIRYISPLAPQLDFLRIAEFEGIDVYWKQLDHVIYGGRRPA